MRRIGNFWPALLLLGQLWLASFAQADLTATVDRDRVALGDTVRLTITATGDEHINNINLRPLGVDFTILNRATNNSISIINGERTQTRELILDISPKREGTVRIPPLRVGRDQTNFLLISVGPAATTDGQALVSFEAELDTDSVYVQGQAVLTLRVQQAINLEARSITELQLDNAFIKQLEQNSFQRTVNGRTWLVNEIRYAIFPEHSGTLEIPSQTFSAREAPARRSMFDRGNTGRLLSRTSDALTLEVRPKPASYPANAAWLPTTELEIDEHWSTAPAELRVGESATRRITLRGAGLQGAQLPPVLFPATPGLKYYPDQPVLENGADGASLMGSRQDSAALVPTRAGNWTLPEIRVPWWDTQAEQVRYAVIPATEVTVAPALEDSEAFNPATPMAVPAVDSQLPAAPAPNGAVPGRFWPVLAGISTLGWLLTGGLWWRSRRSSQDATTVEASTTSADERAAFKSLLAACASGQASGARHHLIRWGSAFVGDNGIHSLDQLATALADPGLTPLLAQLDQGLYSGQEASWNGSALATEVKRLRKAGPPRHNDSTVQLALYPTTAQASA